MYWPAAIANNSHHIFSMQHLKFSSKYVVCLSLFFRQSRLMAYRAFVGLMKRGTRLGKGVRVVIPSCVVSCIRDRFPSPDGLYTGFQSAVFTWNK